MSSAAEEFRRARRRKVSDAILVIDAMSGATVGRIGNLSETGMLLIASAPLTDEALYQFRFKLPDDEGKDAPYEFGVHMLWTDASSTPGMAWAGLRFIAIPDDQGARLRAWIEAPDGEYA